MGGGGGGVEQAGDGGVGGQDGGAPTPPEKQSFFTGIGKHLILTIQYCIKQYSTHLNDLVKSCL